MIRKARTTVDSRSVVLVAAFLAAASTPPVQAEDERVGEVAGPERERSVRRRGGGARLVRWPDHGDPEVGGDRREHPAPELYDLEKDISELHDVANWHPDVVKRLLALAEQAWVDLGDGDRDGKNTRPAGHVQHATTLTFD